MYKLIFFPSLEYILIYFSMSLCALLFCCTFNCLTCCACCAAQGLFSFMHDAWKNLFLMPNSI